MRHKTKHLHLEPDDIKLLLAALESEYVILDKDIVGHLTSAPEVMQLINKIKDQLTLET